MTTLLSFQVPDYFAIEEADLIPVEITDEELTPRAVSRLGQAVTLESGVYGATATLPDGRKLSGAVRIEEGAESAVVVLAELFAVPARSAAVELSATLSPTASTKEASAAGGEDGTELGDAPAVRVVGSVESNDVARESRGSPNLTRGTTDHATPIAFAGKLALLKGNPWTWSADTGPEPEVPGEWRNVDASSTEQPNVGFISLPVQGSETAQSLLFLRPDRCPVVVALPLEPGSHCNVQLRQTPKDGIFPHISFCDHDVDLLLRYAGAGLLGEARKVADAPSVLARDFIEEKEEHPVGAALGFYLLLRLGDESLSISWIKRLVDSALWLPDGLIIHAELLARQGEHGEAAHVLARLPQIGLPFFTSGLSYAVERLGQYESWVAKGHTEVVEGLPEIHAVLRQISLCSDPTRPILTYQVGSQMDRSTYEAAIGRAVSLTTLPPARPSRSVEFRAPPSSPEGEPATTPSGMTWSRAFRPRGASRPADATSATDADTSQDIIGEP